MKKNSAKKTAAKSVAKKSAAKSAPPHPITHGKSLIYGDCLEVMNRWLAEGHAGKVDLIYLDPPFNSKAKYNVLYGKESANGEQAQVIAFNDTWEWGTAAAERMDDLSRNYSDAIKRAMDGLHAMLGESGMLSYLSYMAQRLDRCRRMLADTGSIYLHCDPTASHYLKTLMDAIFGAANFRNEIIWSYRRWANKARKYQSMHDVLLFYAKPGTHAWNWPMEPKSPNTPRYRRWNEVGPGGKLTTHSDKSVAVHETNMRDVWEVSWLQSQDKERTGYPTQKPLALLRRVILASSGKGDLVLDPFCGCGTTVVAANELARKWAGIDISPFPVELIRARLHDIRKQIHVEGIPHDIKGARLLAKKPFEFEKWAIALTPGLRPNERQTADGGVDGIGWLERDINGAIKPPAAKTPLVIAQVTKSPRVDLNKIRALSNSMRENSALFGVYITLEKIEPTPSIRKILAAAGKVKDREREYPCLQLWSVEDYFAGREAKLPPLTTQRIFARGAKGAKIIQRDLSSESF